MAVRAFIATVILLIFPAFTLAQESILTTDVNQLSIQSSPELPAPGQTVNLRLVEYGHDLNQAIVSWYINGTLVAEERGKLTHSITLGSVGSKTTVTVLATLPETVLSGEEVFNVADVDILWETQTTVPELYKGKALYSRQADLKLVALPHVFQSSTRVSAKNLVYTWKKNGKVLQDMSGYGKNVATISGSSVYRPFTVELEVSTFDKSVFVKKRLFVDMVDTEIVFYPVSQLYGPLYQRALSGTLNVKGDEITILAEPYFFSSHAQLSDPVLTQWEINNSVTGLVGREVTFGIPENQPGESLIQVDMAHAKHIMQRARNTLQVVFSSDK